MATVPSHLFIHTATISRNAEQAMQGDVEPGATVTFSIRCMVQNRRGDSTFRSGAERTQYDAVLYCDPSESILTTDKIVFNGKDYQVVDINNEIEMDVVKRIGLRVTAL